jgi:hypothetical protein
MRKAHSLQFRTGTRTRRTCFRLTCNAGQHNGCSDDSPGRSRRKAGCRCHSDVPEGSMCVQPHWLSVDRWRPLRSAAGCSRTLPGGGVRRRARRGWHVIAKCEDGNSGHHDPDDKCRQEPSAAVSVTERSLSVGVQAWIGLLRLSELSVGRLAIDHSFPLPVVGPTRL